MDLHEIRARDAKAKSAWYRGDTDRHPHGLSGWRYILPSELTGRVDDGGEWEFYCGGN